MFAVLVQIIKGKFKIFKQYLINSFPQFIMQNKRPANKTKNKINSKFKWKTLLCGYTVLLCIHD